MAQVNKTIWADFKKFLLKRYAHARSAPRRCHRRQSIMVFGEAIPRFCLRLFAGAQCTRKGELKEIREYLTAPRYLVARHPVQ
jgi:hypothetical protein